MNRLLPLLAALLLALAGCGGDDDGNGDQPSGDEAQIEDTIKTWLIEGDCDLMTDKFVEDQTLGIGDSREEGCEVFENQHTEPQYDEDDINVDDIEVNGSRATAVVGDDQTNIESKYTLVKDGERWQIDAADLQ